MKTELDKVIVFVGDVEACAAWYAQHLGLAVVEETHDEGMWAEVAAGGGCTIAFHQAFGPDGPVKGSTGSPGSPHKLVFRVDSVSAARRQLIDAGVTMFEIAGEGDAFRCDGLDCEEHRFQLFGPE